MARYIWITRDRCGYSVSFKKPTWFDSGWYSDMWSTDFGSMERKDDSIKGIKLPVGKKGIKKFKLVRFK